MQRNHTPPFEPKAFLEKKARILRQLAIPGEEYTDASPKGSVDEGIRELIGVINAAQGLVTTSSCAGRVSVFLEGKKAAVLATAAATHSECGGDDDSGDGAAIVNDGGNVNVGNDAERLPETVARLGGKGGGGKWLFVSHDPIATGDESWMQGLGLELAAEVQLETESRQDNDVKRLIHFKFEPLILHVLTASPAHAQLVLKCALQAGFRESGAINIIPASTLSPSSLSSSTSQSSLAADPATPIVAVRSMGLGFESLIGCADHLDTHRRMLVSRDYLRTLAGIANERFAENTRRIARFRDAFEKAISGLRQPSGWEDQAVRRERLRAEGLKRQAERAKSRKVTGESEESDDVTVEAVLDLEGN